MGISVRSGLQYRSITNHDRVRTIEAQYILAPPQDAVSLPSPKVGLGYSTKEVLTAFQIAV